MIYYFLSFPFRWSLRILVLIGQPNIRMNAHGCTEDLCPHSRWPMRTRMDLNGDWMPWNISVPWMWVWAQFFRREMRRGRGFSTSSALLCYNIVVERKFSAQQCAVHLGCALQEQSPRHCARKVHILSALTGTLCSYKFQNNCIQWCTVPVQCAR